MGQRCRPMDTSTPESRRTTATSSESNPSSVPSVPLAHRPSGSLASVMTRAPGRRARLRGAGSRFRGPFAAPHGVDADLRPGSPAIMAPLIWSTRRLVAASTGVDAVYGASTRPLSRESASRAAWPARRESSAPANAGSAWRWTRPSSAKSIGNGPRPAMMGARTRDWKNHGPFHGSPENSGLSSSVTTGRQAGPGSPTMSTRTPPNGRRLRRAPWRNQSRQSMRSARAMAASSTMMWSNAR